MTEYFSLPILGLNRLRMNRLDREAAVSLEPQLFNYHRKVVGNGQYVLF